MNQEIEHNLQTPKKTRKQKLLALSLILLVFVVGMGTAAYLIKSKPKVKQRKAEKIKSFVEVTKAERINTDVLIKSYGTVVASKEIYLVPQVSGKVIYVSNDFVPGGILKKGRIVAAIDDADYKLIVEQKRAALEKAKASLRLEEGQQEVAKKEWKMLRSSGKSDLALRVPQLKQAQANVKSVRSDLKKSLLDLERTKIKAPFNAMVVSKSFDIGSFVSSQTQLAKLVGIDNYWVSLSFPIDRLSWISVSDSTVTLRHTNQLLGKYEYKGKIIRLLGELETGGLNAQMLVSIVDPLGANSKLPPLLLGSYMQAEIKGKELKNIFRIPRKILQDDNTVLIASHDNKLIIRNVNIVWKDEEFVYIDKGLSQGELLITSSVVSPIPGMSLVIIKNNNRKQIKED